MKKPILWYIADPMCSWCWGFAPVIEKVWREYSTSFTVKVLPGGLRPGTDTPLLPEKRSQILHHWHSVQATTGQPFTFENALPEGFIYDTEPACRGVVSVSLIELAKIFPFLTAVQHAFYVGQEDVTQSDEVKQQTQAGFKRAAQWGINGFPALVVEDGVHRHLITSGYCSFGALRQSLDAWLQKHRHG